MNRGDEFKPTFKRNMIISQIADKIDEINNIGRPGSQSPIRSNRGKLSDLKKDLFVEFFANNHDGGSRNFELSQITQRIALSTYSEDSLKADNNSDIFKRKINELMDSLNKRNGVKETSRIQR
jgi:hypothetical protein